jgi:phosphatidate cytidylyltransferase
MLLRFVSGGIALLIIGPVLFFGGQIGTEALIGIILMIVLREYSAVASPEHPKMANLMLSLVGACVYLSVIWGSSEFVPVTAVLGVATLLTWSMFAHEEPLDGAISGAITAIAVPYLAMAMAFIAKVRALDEDLSWLCFVLVCTWAADTGAYFAGRFLGKRKLCERISPKKTWEGVWGGMALTTVLAVVMSHYSYPAMEWYHAVALGLLISSTGVVGDLVESMFKRARNIKDSGGIMPGHGGLFDRVDSLLFTMPVAWAYVFYFGLHQG